MGQMVRKRLFALIIIPMLLIPIAGLSYAHFTDSVVKKYKLHVAGPEIEIKNYTIVTWCKLKHIITVSAPMLPTDTIYISSKIFRCWFVWIGLLLHNQGCMPAKLNIPEYIFVNDTHNVEKWFLRYEYFYGPYTEDEFEAARDKVWDNLYWRRMPPKCQPRYNLSEPLQPCQRVVLWIKLKFKPPECWCSCSCPCRFNVTIAIKIASELPELTEYSCWTWPPT